MNGLKLIAVLLVFADMGCSQHHRPQEAVREKPYANIILILADDLDHRSVAYLPTLKALITDQGTSFSNYFVSSPLCCPSRASILRGQYVHNTQVLSNQAPDGGFVRFRDLGHETSTIATWLHDAGYRTALFGKYLNGYPENQPTYIPPGWDEWYGKVNGDYFNYQLNENGHIVSYGRQPSDYETDVLSRHVTDFINRRAGAPFFIYLAPYAPHGPYTPAPRHQKAVADLKAPRVPSFNEADVRDKPEWLAGWPLLSDDDIDQMDALFRKRLRLLLAVEEMIQRLLDTLAEVNELANTYIFFTSDNGFHLGEHRLPKGKDTPYDEVTRMPLMVRCPDVPKAQTVEHFVQNVDLAPTVAELAGAKTPGFVDGRPFVPLLRDHPPSTKTWRQGALIEHSSGKNVPGFQALRTKEYLYVEYVTGERELYDLRTDPYQLQSLHDTAGPALIARLAKQLDVLRKCAGANCFPSGVAQ